QKPGLAQARKMCRDARLRKFGDRRELDHAELLAREQGEQTYAGRVPKGFEKLDGGVDGSCISVHQDYRMNLARRVPRVKLAADFVRFPRRQRFTFGTSASTPRTASRTRFRARLRR